MKLRDCFAGVLETPLRNEVYERKDPGTVRVGKKHEATLILARKTKSSKHALQCWKVCASPAITYCPANTVRKLLSSVVKILEPDGAASVSGDSDWMSSCTAADF